MSNIVVPNAGKHPQSDNDRAIWEAYRLAAIKAQNSLDIEDGVRAGKAWAAWLDHFRVRA